MEKQTSFAQGEYGRKKKTTRREKLLAQMEAAVPWTRLVALIVPHYPSGKRGRPPVGIERMLRLYFLAQWYPFHIIRNIFRHRKVRYRGLAKNTGQLRVLFALANLSMVRRQLACATAA